MPSWLQERVAVWQAVRVAEVPVCNEELCLRLVQVKSAKRS